MKARDLKPGMVIELGESLAICVSFETPAGTIPRPKARLYCEPGFVILKHQQGDRWVQTHMFTYALFKLDEELKCNDSLRVQVPARIGKFLGHDERVAFEEEAA